MAVTLNSGQRSSDLAEQQMILLISNGEFPTGGELPPERQLAVLLGVGRPALREALQRLERDGWITQRKGRPALINNFWQKGNLNTLVNLAQTAESLPEEFIAHLLELRAIIAPAYISQAVERNSAKVVALLAEWEELLDQGQAYAVFDWELHKKTAFLSENPLYVFLLNSFEAVYIPLATRYFQWSKHRQISRQFYQMLLIAAMSSDEERTAFVVKEAMKESIVLWKEKDVLEE